MQQSSAVRGRYKLSIYVLTFTAIVFRSEIAILLATQVCSLVLQRRASIYRDIIPAGVLAAAVGLLVTVPIDSYFWLRFPLWPELAGFYFNAIEGKAVQWGSSPWWFYFGNSIPRLLMNPLTWQLCIPLALGMRATRKQSLDMLAPLLAFVSVYSLQPHKEWRFIIYVIPGLTAVAAMGANWIWTRRTKSAVYWFLSMALIASTLATLAVSLVMLTVSRLNYPGAEALMRVHQLGNKSQIIINVHMDTLSCTTGITRFLEVPASSSLTEPGQTLWMYDKTEDEDILSEPHFWKRFDYVLAEQPEKVIGNWETVDIVEGFGGIEIARLEQQEQENTKEDVSEAKRVNHSSILIRLSTLKQLELFLRKHITKGRWIKIKMKPMIHIMRKQRVDAVR